MSANAPIDLCDSSDDESDEFQRAIRMSLAEGTSSSGGKADTPNPKTSKTPVPVSYGKNLTISQETKQYLPLKFALCSYSFPLQVTTSHVKKEKRKKPVGTSSSSSSASKKTKASNVGDYNDVMVIEKEKLPNPVINLQEKDLGGDDDLVVVGEQVSALSQYALSSLYPILTPPLHLS